MSSQEVKRQRIADLLLAGVKIRCIVETVGVSMSTAYNIKGQISVGGGIKELEALGSGGMNKKWDFVFLKSLKTKILKDPTESMRKLSRDIKVSPQTIRWAVLLIYICEDPKTLFDKKNEIQKT